MRSSSLYAGTITESERVGLVPTLAASRAASPPLRLRLALGPEPLEPAPMDVRPLFRGRQHVERAYYEKAHAASLPSVPYLGRITNGRWEIRGALAKAALGHVLGGLVKTGHVVELADGGFVAAHRYRRGTPYERRRLGGPQRVEEVALSEYELERRARIERNQAFLASLGFT